MPELYLLDIEGTTSPITFVYDVLFPYARKHMLDYVTRHSANPELQEDLALLVQENQKEQSKNTPLVRSNSTTAEADFLRSSVTYLLWLMDQDRKSTALKSIQGKIWAAGYEQGELQSEVFPDVPPALERWSRVARVAIYSSGSVAAQKDLFTYTRYGNLTPYIEAYFDTHIGAKAETGSYTKIAAEMGVLPANILFISDALKEVDAANRAGLATLLSMRPGNPAVQIPEGQPSIRSFAEIA
jgi:enolase-phosphatase E1